MRILITGAAGFIGSAIFRECVINKEKWNIDSVLGVDIDSFACDKLRMNLGTDWANGTSHHLINVDFCSSQILDQVSDGMFDRIIHLAALPRVAYSVENPRRTDEYNINKSVALLESCLKSNTSMVFASSSSVYGGAKNLPTFEDEPLKQISPYALQKATFEKYLNIYKDIKNYNSIILRFFNVYGPGQDGSSAYSTVLAAWMHKIKNGLPISMEGDGEQRRDFCYIGDVVNACLLSAQKADSMHEAFNIGCGKNYSCNELLNYLTDRFADGMISVSNKPPRPGDVRETLASIEKAKRILGYEPQADFWKGVDNTIDWWFS
jgi:UDP-glucose 4-epimerase